MAGLAALGLFAAACSTGGTGTRDEGSALTTPAQHGAPTPRSSGAGAASAKTVDPVAVLREDPTISKRIKAELKPCSGAGYPVDTSYGNLTGGTVPDVVINVLTCGDSVGIGTFVYREKNDAYENVFTAEEPAVYATIDRGELVVTQQIYARGDSVTFPSGEDVVTYGWADTKFSERYRVRNDYSRAVGNGDGNADESAAPSEN
ncbi:hypothetical protein [Streptomyces sp. NPDC093109]|uniref:hypothetical protein n=1 Tax=Streptomyces sp. NPDC093109 TaxID=3154977 RepID=UPI003450B144